MRLLIVAAALLLAPAAWSQPAPTAREHYDRGTRLYDLQRFQEAAHEYEAAYELKSDPVLLFNIGQAYRFAREYDKAILAYRAYLRHLPQSTNRPEVEARIADLEKLAAEQKKEQEKPPAGTIAQPAQPQSDSPAAPPPPAPTAAPVAQPAPIVAPAPDRVARPMKIAGLTVGAAGLALIGVGAAFTVLGNDAFDQLDQPHAGQTFDPATESTMKTDRALGTTFLVIGGAAVVAGVVTAVLGFRRGARHVAIAPARGGASVSF